MRFAANPAMSLYPCASLLTKRCRILALRCSSSVVVCAPLFSQRCRILAFAAHPAMSYPCASLLTQRCRIISFLLLRYSSTNVVSFLYLLRCSPSVLVSSLYFAAHPALPYHLFALLLTQRCRIILILCWTASVVVLSPRFLQSIHRNCHLTTIEITILLFL